LNDNAHTDPRLLAIPDIHGHAKGEHKAFNDERPIPLSPRMLFLWFYHACRRGWPRFLMVTDHMNYLTFEDPAAINLVRRALKLAQAGDLYGAAETASVEVGHAAIVSEGLRRGMRYSIGAEVDNDPRSRPDAQNIVDAMKPDGTIRSVHFLTIDHPVHGPNWNWPFDNPEFADVFEIVGTAKTWELYMATLLDAIERLSGNIVGHFYVPALFGHWPDDETLDAYENALVDACDARGMAIEVNTRFFYRDHPDEEKARYLAAHRRLLAKCKAKNVGIAIGSDAHSPKDQGGAFEIVLALLDECDINELVFPIAGRLARVALRVERTVEPEAAPVPAAAEERKAARRARPSDAPAVLAPAAQAVVEPSAEAPNPKARPKRARAKTSEPAVLADAVAPAEPAAFAGEEAGSPNAAARFRNGEAARGDTFTIVSTKDAVDSSLLADMVSDAPLADEAAVSMSPTDDVSVAAVDTDRSAGPDGTAEADLPVVVDVSVERDLAPEPEAVVQTDGAAGTNDVAASGLTEAPASDTAIEPLVAAGSAADAEPALDAEPAGPDHAPTARSSTRKNPAKPAAIKSKADVRPKAAKAKPAPKKAAKSSPKSTAKKAPAKKSAAKKAAAKKAAPKVAAKRPAAKKAAVKKAPAKKAAVRTAAAKKSSVKKSAAKKTGSKKPAQRRR
jgi:HisJ family histidinol phosphate phosphatase